MFKSLETMTQRPELVQPNTVMGDTGESYDRFSTIMSQHGYTWEHFTVTTDDNYELTLFHVTGTDSDGL